MTGKKQDKEEQFYGRQQIVKKQDRDETIIGNNIDREDTSQGRRQIGNKQHREEMR